MFGAAIDTCFLHSKLERACMLYNCFLIALQFRKTWAKAPRIGSTARTLDEMRRGKGKGKPVPS